MLDFGYYNMDCMQGMKEFPDKYFDLAIVDPPYGININCSMGRRKGDKKSEYPKAYWDNEIPNEKYFEELFRAMNAHYASISKSARTTEVYVSEIAKTYRKIMNLSYKDYNSF